MNKIILIALFTLSVFASTPGDGIQGCTGNENPFDLIDTEPTLVSEVANGRKYTIGIFTLIQTMTEENSTLSRSRAAPLKWEKPTEPYSRRNSRLWRNSSSIGLPTMSPTTSPTSEFCRSGLDMNLVSPLLLLQNNSSTSTTLSPKNIPLKDGMMK